MVLRSTNLLASNNITTDAPNTKAVSKSKLGKTVSNATYYLSCWMTMAQIQKMQAQKVIFEPPREYRRLISLSQAALANACSC